MSREDKKRSNKQWNRHGKGKSTKMDLDSREEQMNGPRGSGWEDVEYLSRDNFYDGDDDVDWDDDLSEDDESDDD